MVEASAEAVTGAGWLSCAVIEAETGGSTGSTATDSGGPKREDKGAGSFPGLVDKPIA